jgi:uncharacterized protein YutE (UPF0331/DUF86 family)
LSSAAGKLKGIETKQNNQAIHRANLHLAVEACLDIGNHIIADSQLREPRDYKDIVVVLTETGFLPPARLENLKK